MHPNGRSEPPIRRYIKVRRSQKPPRTAVQNSKKESFVVDGNPRGPGWRLHDDRMGCALSTAAAIITNSKSKVDSSARTAGQALLLLEITGRPGNCVPPMTSKKFQLCRRFQGIATTILERGLTGTRNRSLETARIIWRALGCVTQRGIRIFLYHHQFISHPATAPRSFHARSNFV